MSAAVRGNKAGRYVVHVWNVYCGCILHRRGFDTFSGAQRFAEKESAKDEVREAVVTGPGVPDGDGIKDWGPRLIVARNGEVVATAATA